jgi:hypothetical protein
MLTPEQIEVEVFRLNNITYDIVWKHHKITQNRIIRLGQLLRRNGLQFSKMYFMYITIVRKFNALCNQANGTPQSY